MKKRLTMFIVLIALVIGTFSGISVSAAPIATAEFFDSYGDAITVLTDENEISAKISLVNPPPYSCNANVVAALFENGKMSGFNVVATANVTADKPATILVEDFSIGNADEVKLFVWKGFDSLSPLVANPCTISRKVYKPFATVEPVDGKVAENVTLTTEGVTANVPAGVVLEDGVKTLGLIVTPILNSNSGIQAGENEKLESLDIHVEGVAKNNTTPIIVTVEDATAIGLNSGNLALYHVENGETVKMTQVSSADELTSHNSFFYDAVTGSVTLALCSFSEIAMVSDTENAWNGEYATSFADGNGTANDPYIIANADQLAYLGEVISNDEENYADKHYKLVADINIGGEEHYYNNYNEETGEGKKILFYPIGYHKRGEGANKAGETEWYTYGGAFMGTFDGNGHKVSGLYQRTWDLDGNYDYGYWDDAMGLFGYVYGGTVKNLTVENFSSDGEFTPTGCVAAYATNSTFENIALVNCNPRVYNTGNGGIVGIGGNSDDPEDFKLTFNNITIDNTNKITALWGSWDVACGGLVGMFRGAGHVYMNNCHVGAQIDVYNDVCGNYQYYWYRYAGMLVGTNKTMVTDENGYTVPETSKYHAKNCTVHFGDWNNYWYCELVANSLASYTHDHQFSRLTRVDAVDVTNKTVTVNGVTSAIPETGRANYVVIDTSIVDENGKVIYSSENATCYHFVDGKVWNHEEAGKETVNGVEVLKEDNQHIYLPFNQLFTGYGWGVKHIPVYNGEDYAFAGVTILDRTQADSEVKFNAKVGTTEAEPYEVLTGSTVALEDLFGAVEGKTINTQSVHVSVTKVDTEASASADYTINRNNWALGSVKFSGAGLLKLTIQDYNYCTPTVLYVNVVSVITNIEDTFINTYKDEMDLSSYEVGTILNNSNVSDTKLISFAGVGSSARVSEITGTAGKTIDYANPIDITEKVTASGNEKVTVEEVNGEKVIKLEVKKGYRNAGIGLAPISGASLVNASANEIKYFQFDLYQPDAAHKLGTLNIGFAKIGADGKVTYYDVNELKASDPAKFSAISYTPQPGGDYGVAPVFYYEHSIPKLHTISRHNPSTGAYLGGGAFGEGAPSFLHLNGVGVDETAKIYDHWYSNSFGFQYVSGVGIRIKSRSSYDVNNETWSGYNNCLIPLTAEELADIKNVKIVPIIAINGFNNDTYTYIKDLRGSVETGYTKSTVEETEIIALDNFESNEIGLANQTAFNSAYIKGFGVYSNRHASGTSSNSAYKVSVEATPDGYAGNSSAKALKVASTALNESAWAGFRSQPIPTSIFTSNVNGATISYDTLRTGSNAGNGRIYFYSSDANGNRAAANENDDKSDAFKIMSHMVSSSAAVNFTFNSPNGLVGENHNKASYSANKNWIRVEFNLRAADDGTAIVKLRSCNLATGVWTKWTDDITFPLDLYSASHLVWAENYNKGESIAHYYDNFMLIGQKANALPVVKGSTDYSVLADDTLTVTLDSVVAEAGKLSKVELKDSEGNVVPANVTGIVMGTKSVVSIDPVESLTAGNTYTVDFKGNKLLNGNAVINPVFTVAEAPVTEAPEVIYNGTDSIMKGETFTVAMKLGEETLTTDKFVVYADSDAVTITEADGVYNITAAKDGKANIYVQSLLHSGVAAEKFALSVVVPDGIVAVTFTAENYGEVVEIDSTPINVIKGGKLTSLPEMTNNKGISPVKYIIGENEYTRDQLLGLTINEPLEIKVRFKMNRIYNYDFDLTTMTEAEYALTPFADETRWTFVPGVGIKLSDNGTTKSPEVKFWSNEEDTAYVFEYDYIQGKGEGEKTHGGFDADFYSEDGSKIERFFHTTNNIHTCNDNKDNEIRGFENIKAGADNETVHTMTHVMDRANNKSVVMLDGVVGINQYDKQDLTFAKAPYRFVMATNAATKATGKFIITRLSFKSYESINIPTVSVSAGENISSAKMGSVTSRKIPEGGKIAVTATAVNHYELDRWDITGEGSVENGYFTAGAVDTQLKAIAKPKSYTVTFDAGENGTIAEGAVQSVVYNTYPTAPEVTANEGYTFLSWDKTITKATGDVTYTAQYTTNPTYAIKFTVLNPNTAVVDETINVEQGETLTGLPTKQGKMSAQFKYWEGEDGTHYTDDELMAKVFEADETFTAVYAQTRLNAGIYDFDKYGYDLHAMSYDGEIIKEVDEEGVKFIRLGTHKGKSDSGATITKTLSIPLERVTEGTWAFTLDFKYKGGGFDSDIFNNAGNTGTKAQGIFLTKGGYTYCRPVASINTPMRDADFHALANIADGERHTLTWFFDLDNDKFRLMVDGVLVDTYEDELINNNAIGSMFLAFKGYEEEGDSAFDIYRIGFEKVEGELINVTTKVNGNATSSYLYTGSAYAGDKVFVKVTPHSNYKLINWTVNGEEVSTELKDTITVTEDSEIVANLERIMFRLTYHTNEHVKFEGVDGDVYVTDEFPSNTVPSVTLGDAAVPTLILDEGWEFYRWQKVGTKNQYTYRQVADTGCDGSVLELEPILKYKD